MRFLRILCLLVAGLLGLGCVVWAAGALFFDLPWPALRMPVAVGYLLLVVALFVGIRGAGRR